LDIFWTYLALVNLGSFCMMGFDKLSAKVGSERVSERWFILASLAGGFVGVLLGMFAFHHKVSKTSFQIKVGAATIPAILVLLILFKGK